MVEELLEVDLFFGFSFFGLYLYDFFALEVEGFVVCECEGFVLFGAVSFCG